MSIFIKMMTVYRLLAFVYTVIMSGIIPTIIPAIEVMLWLVFITIGLDKLLKYSGIANGRN